MRIDPTCGLHEGSLPNTWSTKKDHQEYTESVITKLSALIKSSNCTAIITTEKDLVKLSSLITRNNAQNPIGHKRNFYFEELDEERCR